MAEQAEKGKAIALLEANGWEVECYSPFEIRTKDGSFASQEGADIILASLKYDVTPSVVLTFDEVRICIKALNSLQTTLTMQSCSRDFGSEELFEKLLAKFYTAHEVGLENWKK